MAQFNICNTNTASEFHPNLRRPSEFKNVLEGKKMP